MLCCTYGRNPGRPRKGGNAHPAFSSGDNENTRRACGRALASFFAFVENGGRDRVQDMGPLDVRDYLEAATGHGLSTAIPKQHMAAVRMLFDHLMTGGVLGLV